jgi:hypothetical protein
MIIEDEVHHMKTGTCWFTDTRFYHSQFNGSEADRIHMVMCVVDKDYKSSETPQV